MGCITTPRGLTRYHGGMDAAPTADDAFPLRRSDHPLHWPKAPHPDDEKAFWAHRLEEGVRAWRLVLFGGVVVTVAWWPTDFWLFAHRPDAIEAFAFARGFAAAIALAMYVLVMNVAAFRKRPYLAMSTVAAAVAFVGGWQFGRLGGPGEVWIHFTHLMVLTPVALSLRHAHRVALTVTLASAIMIGMFVMHPEHRQDPLAATTVSWFLFLVVFSVLIGLFADALRRREFFQRRAIHRLAEELRTLKESLEHQVAERTTEVRQLAANVESARELERARIAGDLHDELGQELTALRYAIELTRRRWTNDPTSIGANFEDVEGLVQRTRQTTRAILSDLRPRVLDDLGFHAASEWLVQRMRDRTGLAIELVSTGGEPELPERVATAAFRVLQESLTNAVRHAQALRIEVTIAATPDALALTVTDDGVGFDPVTGRAAGGGFGLIGMRERATTLSGSFDVESAPGRGTRIHLLLPRPPAVERAS